MIWKRLLLNYQAPPSLQSILGSDQKFSSPSASLAPLKIGGSNSGKPEMSDEEAEAYDLLNALQAQNDSRSGLDLDYGDDDLEEFEGEGGKNGGRGS